MMWEAVEKLQFEKAAKIRDKLQEMEEKKETTVVWDPVGFEEEGGKYFRAASGNRHKKRKRT